MCFFLGLWICFEFYSQLILVVCDIKLNDVSTNVVYIKNINKKIKHAQHVLTGGLLIGGGHGFILAVYGACD